LHTQIPTNTILYNIFSIDNRLFFIHMTYPKKSDGEEEEEKESIKKPKKNLL